MHDIFKIGVIGSNAAGFDIDRYKHDNIEFYTNGNLDCPKNSNGTLAGYIVVGIDIDDIKEDISILEADKKYYAVILNNIDKKAIEYLCHRLYAVSTADIKNSDCISIAISKLIHIADKDIKITEANKIISEQNRYAKMGSYYQA